MKCIECGSKMNKAKQDYRYIESGLKNVILKNTIIYSCDNCSEEEVVIPNIEKLHMAIARVVASQVNKLRPVDIRYLRTYLGLSGRQFAEIVKVKPETVSRWESGKQSLSSPTESLLRVIVLSGMGPFRNYDDLIDFGSRDTVPSKTYFVLSKDEWKTGLKTA